MPGLILNNGSVVEDQRTVTTPDPKVGDVVYVRRGTGKRSGFYQVVEVNDDGRAKIKALLHFYTSGRSLRKCKNSRPSSRSVHPAFLKVVDAEYIQEESNGFREMAGYLDDLIALLPNKTPEILE